MKINKEKLARMYAKKYKISVSEAKRRIDEVSEVIVSNLEQGNDVMLSKFFNFKVKERAAKRARHLQTRESIIIPATKTVVVQMSTSVKKRVQGK